MLIDEVSIILTAGHGGAGKVSFRPGMKGPDGGNGGRGGAIWGKATQDITALNYFQGKKQLRGINGDAGGSNSSSGKDGADIELNLPVGTSILDKATGEAVELTTVDQRILICRGGLGGKGNEEFKSSLNTTPRYAQKGLPGQEKKVKLILRLIADYGLIGLPNAGKSSLLNELTRAQAKVGSYPFTTLEPNLGVFSPSHLERSEGSKILADIPGLIEGASTGKGLGIKFLKHIEKVGLLIHCIAADSTNVVEDYQVIDQEMTQFNPALLDKKRIILLTKSDLVDPKTIQKQIKLLQKFAVEVYLVSIYDYESIEKLKKLLRK